MTPNRRTLVMNPGDKLASHIFGNKSTGVLETQLGDLSAARAFWDHLAATAGQVGAGPRAAPGAG